MNTNDNRLKAHKLIDHTSAPFLEKGQRVTLS